MESGGKPPGPQGDDALFADVIEVLFSFQGAAHRAKVAEVLSLRHFGAPPSSDFCDQLYGKVCARLKNPDGSDFCTMVHLPFGPESYRWALTYEAMALLKSRQGAE